MFFQRNMPKDKVYVTGSAGLVGSRFVELFSASYELLTPEIEELNILDINSLEDFFERNDLTAVVNFAAFTDVSAAEAERGNEDGLCYKVNALGVSNLVKVCEEYRVFLVQISTDMVFPGIQEWPGPYSEDEQSETNLKKLSWYGFTKAEGERKVLSYPNSAILRINYPVRAYFPARLDFLRKPLSLFDEGRLYPLFDDQQISISFIDEVALAIDLILKSKKKGVYHASSSDLTTPFEIVSYLIEKLRGKNGVVNKSSLREYVKNGGNPLRHPLFGGLKVDKTQKVLGIKFSSCREIVDKLINSNPGLK